MATPLILLCRIVWMAVKNSVPGAGLKKGSCNRDGVWWISKIILLALIGLMLLSRIGHSQMADGDENITDADAVFLGRQPAFETDIRTEPENNDSFSIMGGESGSNDQCTTPNFFPYLTDYGSGSVSPSGDVDWWSFTVGESNTYGLLMSISGGGNLDTYLYNTCSSMACSAATSSTTVESCLASLSAGTHYVKVLGSSTATGSYQIVINPRCESDQCCWDKYGYCYAHCGNSGEPACSTTGSSLSHCISKVDTMQGNFICSGTCAYSCPTDNDPNKIGGLDCCSCSCTSGSCCNGCSYRSTSYVCNNNAGSETGCNCYSGPESDTYRRDSKQYCSGSSTSCAGSIAWNPWQLFQDCIGSYKNEYLCSGSMLQRKYSNVGCVSGSCQGLGDVWKDQQNCGSNSCGTWGQNYCKDSDVYHSKTCNDRGCSGSACYDNPRTEEVRVTDCPDSGYVDEYQCSGSTKQRKYVTNGCSSGSCQSSFQWNFYQDCGTDTTGDWSALQCIGNNTGRYRIATYRGCLTGSCYSNPVTESTITETCQYGCENAECIKYPDLAVTEADILFEKV